MRQQAIERHKVHGNDHLLSVDLSQSDDWLAQRTQACFLEPGYNQFLLYYSSPHTIEGEIWLGYRRLSGDRSTVIVPMGGAIPGEIPWVASQAYLEYRGVFDESEYEIVRSTWDQMDSVMAEYRNGSGNNNNSDNQ